MRRTTLLMLASACVTALVGSAQAQNTSPATDADLVGLWGSETLFGPQVRGEIVLVRAERRWTMRAGGFEASAESAGDTVRVALPGGQGELRAHLEPGGAVVRGFWVQPAGNLPPYASPVELRQAGDGAWRGTVTPLDDHFSLYLLITREPGGALRGIVRNPDFNWSGRWPWFRVTRGVDELRLADSASGRVRFTQPYDSAQRRISMDFGAPIALVPRTPERAVGFYPRSPSAASYAYRAPLAREDGWAVARAARVGLEEARLQALVARIIATDPAADSAPRIHSLLVARGGKLVLEEYFHGYGADRPHDLRSASKTFTSVMAGAAMLAGAPFDMSTPISRFFPGDSLPGTPDPRKGRITVGQLLTHSTGLACDDNDGDSRGNEQTMQQQGDQPDWYRYILALPVVHDPGSRYAYCSGTMSLAGGVVSRATRAWLPDFFDRHVARPMQITRYHMNLMPTGEAYAGGGVHMLPRDLLKFGEVYLRGGRWNGRRIVSERWVRESTGRQIATPDGGSDGYGWHRYTLKVGERSYQEFEANGNGGQFLIMVPELDLAVVFTAGAYNRYGIWRKFRDELVPEYIMAAVRGR
jgi:CubicO group peptidase (beta-lactamase class C family)